MRTKELSPDENRPVPLALAGNATDSSGFHVEVV